MSSAGTSTDRTGSSRREELENSLGKPLVTRKVQASSSAEESGGDSSAELDAAGSTKDSETSREPEVNAAGSDDGPPDLPEGTVVVEPEPVAESKLIFSGPEFPSKRRSNQAGFGNPVTKVTCTSCGKQLNPSKKGAIKRHPKLKVIVCKKCYKYYSSGEISQDADGLDEQCRWCGEGGRLLGCDFCHNAFCKGCILRNLGRSELRIITDAGSEKWKCYVCDPPKLKELVSHCNEVFNQLEEERNREDLMQIKQAKSQRKPSAPSGKKFDAVSIIPICDESMNVTPKTLGIVIEKLLVATTSMTFMLNTLQTDIKESDHLSDQAALAEGHSPAELGVIKLKKGLVKYFLALKETLFASEIKDEKSQNDNLNKKSSTKTCSSSVTSNSKKLKNSIKEKGKVNNTECKYTKSRNSSSDSDEADLKSRKTEQNKGQEKHKHKDSSSFSSSVKVKLESNNNCRTNEISFMSEDDDDDDDDDVEFLGESKLMDDIFVDGDKVDNPFTNNWCSKEIKSESPSLLSDSSEVSNKVSHVKEGSAHHFHNEHHSHRREQSRNNESVKMTGSHKEASKKRNRDEAGQEKMSRKRDQDEERTPRKKSAEKYEKSPKKRDDKTTPIKTEDKSSSKLNREDHKKSLVKVKQESSNDDSDLSVDDIPLIKRSQKTDKKTNEERKKKPARERMEEDQKCNSEVTPKKNVINETEKPSPLDEKSKSNPREVHNSIKNHTNSFLSNKPLHDPENAAAQLSLLMEMANEISKNQGNDSDNSADNHLDHDADNMEDEDEDDFSQFTNHVTDNFCDNNDDDDFDINGTERSETPKLTNSGEHADPASKTKKEDLSDVDQENGNSGDATTKVSQHTDNESSSQLTPNKRRFRNSKVRPRPQSGASDSEEEPCDGAADRRKRSSSNRNKSLSSDGKKKNNDASDSNNQSDGGNPSDRGDPSKNNNNNKRSNDGKKDDNTDSEKDKRDSNDNDSESNNKKSKAKKKETKKQEDGKKSKDNKKGSKTESNCEADSDKEEKKGKKDDEKKIKSKSSEASDNKSDSDSDSSDSSDDSDLYTRKRRRTRMGKNKKEESTQDKKMARGKKKEVKPREKLGRKVKKEKSESSAEEEENVKEEATDEKTKMKTEENSESSNYDSELEKEINKLSQKVVIKKSSRQKKTEKSDTETNDKNKKKGKASKNNEKTEEMSFSDSSHQSAESSDEDDEDKSGKEEEAKIKEEKENAEKLASMIKDADKEDEEEEEEEEEDESSDSDSSGSDIITNKKRKRTDKNGNKKSGEDSTSDAQPKKKKSNRLLQAKLSESDSEKKSKNDKSDASSSNSESDSSGSSSDSDSDSDEDGNKKKKKSKAKGKRGKKSKKDSDSSEDSDESTKKKGKKGKRRKRIKAPKNSSDSGSDTDKNSPGGPSKRKKIRKLISDKKLTDSTKAAAKAEEERRKRVAERQKKFNRVIVDDSVAPTKCPVTKKLVLAFDKEEKPLLEVDKDLVVKLKPHQVEAVQFMFDCCIETISQLKREEGGGCILAHCMGLGKTLSLITFVHTLLVNSKRTKLRTCLVVCPLNTVLNWKDEWEKWDSKQEIDVFEMTNIKNNWHRADALKNWADEGGIMIIGYEMYRNLSQGHHVKNKKQKKIFEECLLNPGPDLVVCDEGHILKNDSSGVSKAMNKIHTKRRIVLTGTPLQNNLIEYHCMVSFVKPNLLGTRKEFCNRFVNPITNGQCSDSTSIDVKIMKRRAHILHDLLDGCVQRKDYNVLTDFLPPKLEYVVLVRLSKVQIELYQRYLDQFSHIAASSTEKRQSVGLFADYQNLMKIWSHPWVLKLDEIRQESKKRYDSDMDSFIDDESEESFSESSSNSSDLVELSDDDAAAPATTVSKPSTSTRASRAARRRGSDDDKAEVVKEWKTRSRGGGGDDEPAIEVEKEKDQPLSTEWWSEYLTDTDSHNLELSGKLKLTFEILEMCEDIGDKVLIFSQSLLSLDLLENFLEYIDSGAAEEDKKKEQELKEKERKNKKEKGEDDDDDEEEGDKKKEKSKEKSKEKKRKKANDFGNSWTKGADYFRLDGSTPAHYRKRWAESFNDPENYRARLFLISTKAGSLGINLVSANRVIIFDASWNPSHDIQSIFRVYRFGQTKPVYIYRLVAQGTMEEKIYDRQVIKQSLSQRVIDEHQIERHFTQADLQELYVFKPERLDDPNVPERPTPILPKDRMLAELLQDQKKWIVTYHEHDSLLEDQAEEKLTEEERKAAWEEYENEKKGIIRRGPTPMQYMNYSMNQPYMNQQMNMNMMQNMYMMQQQMQNNPVISLRSPDIHNIVQRVKALYPNLPPDQFQLKVHEVMRAQINQQIDMQQRQVQEQLKREMARSQQMKAQIARQFDHLQVQQQRMGGPVPLAHGAANMMGAQGGSLSGPGGSIPNSAASSQLMGLLQHGGMPGGQ